MANCYKLLLSLPVDPFLFVVFDFHVQPATRELTHSLSSWTLSFLGRQFYWKIKSLDLFWPTHSGSELIVDEIMRQLGTKPRDWKKPLVIPPCGDSCRGVRPEMMFLPGRKRQKVKAHLTHSLSSCALSFGKTMSIGN